MSFSYSDFPISNNASHLVGDFFRTNFVGLVPESYTSRCLLRDEAVVLEFSYKTISIAYSLGNIHECDRIEIPGVRSWLDVTELLFHLGKTIVVFVMHCSCLWVSGPGSNIRA